MAVCVTLELVGLPDEFMKHPPIAGPFRVPATRAPGPVDLGRGVRIDRLSDDDAQLVMNACSRRGHYFFPLSTLAQMYSFVREVDLEECKQHPYRWDPEQVIWSTLVSSRLIRHNGYATEFAARSLPMTTASRRSCTRWEQRANTSTGFELIETGSTW